MCVWCGGVCVCVFVWCVCVCGVCVCGVCVCVCVVCVCVCLRGQLLIPNAWGIGFSIEIAEEHLCAVVLAANEIPRLNASLLPSVSTAAVEANRNTMHVQRQVCACACECK